jgi:hypothetical protein
LRSTVLLVLAGVAAFAASLRFETAVHPGEISNPRYAREFEAACERLPALGSLRIHSDAPDIGQRLRRIKRSGGIGRIVEVAELERSLRRGTLAAWDAERLARFESQLKTGEDPGPLPPVPDIRPYFRDERGGFACEVMMRDAADTSRVRAALPGAELRGEPVRIDEESRQRTRLMRAAIFALVASVAGYFGLRILRNGAPELEQRLLAMAVPLALLGWSGLGVDVWTIPALVLAGTARTGVGLLAGWALLLSPVLALQRMALVLGTAGLLRLRPAPWMRGPRVGARAWAGAVLLVLIALALLAGPWMGTPAASEDVEPHALFVAANARAREAARISARYEVVGGESYPDARAEVTTRRRLTKIFELATSLAKRAEGADKERYELIADAAARDAVEIPAGLRQRRETTDDAAVLWVLGPEPGAHTHQLYRTKSDVALRRSSRSAALIVFALGLLVRLARGGVAPRDLLAPALAFWVGLVLLSRAELDPLIALMAIAPFCAGWMLPIGVAVASFFVPIELWWGAVILAMAAAAAHPSR